MTCKTRQNEILVVFLIEVFFSKLGRFMCIHILQRRNSMGKKYQGGQEGGTKVKVV